MNKYINHSNMSDVIFQVYGSSNSEIELTIEEVEQYSAFYSWINVCKGWSKNE